VKRLGPIPAGFIADANGELLIGGQSAVALASGGTPLFVYDAQQVAAKVARFRSAFAGVA
jgi:diaminopimelate decarboxylase